MKASRLTAALEIVGAVLIDVGLWQIYHPLGWIAAGAVLFACSYLLELERSVEAPTRLGQRQAPADEDDGHEREPEYADEAFAHAAPEWTP